MSITGTAGRLAEELQDHAHIDGQEDGQKQNQVAEKVSPHEPAP